MIIKIIIIGLCVCVINLLLKNHQSAFIIVINIVFIISVTLLIFDRATETFNKLSDLLNITSASSKMLICLYKSAAVCILSKIAVDICKESGNSSVGDMIDFTSRIVLLIMVMPFVESVIRTATAFVK